MAMKHRTPASLRPRQADHRTKEEKRAAFERVLAQTPVRPELTIDQVAEERRRAADGT